MKVKINGEIRNISDNLTVKQLIEKLNLNPDRIIVEYNGEIIDKEKYETISLKENDKLELIHFVGGG